MTKIEFLALLKFIKQMLKKGDIEDLEKIIDDLISDSESKKGE